MKSVVIAVILFTTSAFASSYLEVPVRVFNCAVPKNLANHLNDLQKNKEQIIHDCRVQGDDTETCENRYRGDLETTLGKIELGQKIMSQWKWGKAKYIIYPAASKKDGKIISATPWLYDLKSHFLVQYWLGSTNEPPAAGFNNHYTFMFFDNNISDPNNNIQKNANITIYNSGDTLYPIAFVEQRISSANSSSAWMPFECQFDHAAE